MYSIRFYQKGNGKAPVKDYIDALVQEAATSKHSRVKIDKIREYIGVLKRLGTLAGVPYVKHIEGEIWELRPTSDRIFFFCHTGSTFVLLHHFQKKTQKTPRHEIEQAKRNRDDYIKAGR